MKTKLLHTPEGYKDVHTNEKSKKNHLVHCIEDTFSRYGYKMIETPTLEYLNIFGSETGTVSTNEIFKFMDYEGQIVALRPDITPSIARFAATFHSLQTFPLRFSYIGNTFRNNVKYSGIMKESTQAGVELIGPDGVDYDAELIAQIVDSLLVCGLNDFQIDIGHVDFVEGLFEDFNLDKDSKDEVKVMLAEKNFFGVTEYLKALEVSEQKIAIFEQLMHLTGSADILKQVSQFELNETSKGAIDYLNQLYTILADYELESYVSFDLSATGELGYYTGIIIKGYTYETGDSIVVGGRYNRLLNQFGKNAPAVGFVIKVDQLLQAMERQKIQLPIEHNDTLVVYTDETRKEALKLINYFRSTGVKVETGLLGQPIEENISYCLHHHIGGLLHFSSKGYVNIHNLLDGTVESMPLEFDVTGKPINF